MLGSGPSIYFEYIRGTFYDSIGGFVGNSIPCYGSNRGVRTDYDHYSYYFHCLSLPFYGMLSPSAEEIFNKQKEEKKLKEKRSKKKK